MRGTFFNAGTSLSIGIFFSMMIIGLSSTLPGALSSGLQSHGLSFPDRGDDQPRTSRGSLFAAFLGANPIGSLLGRLPASDLRGAGRVDADEQATSSPADIRPFHHGLVIVFSAAAVSPDRRRGSLLRGGRYVHEELEPVAADDVVVDDQPTPIRMRGGPMGRATTRARRASPGEPRRSLRSPSVGDVEEERTARASPRREPVVVDHHGVGVNVASLIEVLPAAVLNGQAAEQIWWVL